MSDFKEFKNPWSAENSEWFGEEKEKWGIDLSLSGTFTKKVQIRPKWAKVYTGYPKNNSGTDDENADIVFKSILGDNYDRETFTNACATRVSLGLLNGGVTVKKDFLIQKGEFKGKGFIASAINLKDWLSRSEVWGNADEEIQGPSDLVDVKSAIDNRNGIYIIIGGFGGGVSGHATLWIGTQKDAFGGHNYVSYGGSVYFWELK
ncbi:T6SS effector amidase Tae4 family protein [Flavobacterium sp.]|uniref:T6SS effector amidase Tae4 family protein n=1 Tax=Flavobacterium sp. TaxID=239 RepID=UPI0026113DCF|nr:T6SS effector amidase Tae4 family protein [Flavobacterium sp.]MDD3005443.1 T6SS effector amidase Tae4 family protein [Flavobacterium sp.]